MILLLGATPAHNAVPIFTSMQKIARKKLSDNTHCAWTEYFICIMQKYNFGVFALYNLKT